MRFLKNNSRQGNLNMTVEHPINLDENKQLYLQRVNQFYHLLKDPLILYAFL